MPQKIKTNEWNYNQLILFIQMQDGGIQDGCIELKMAIFRLNLERVCVRFYGSINPIESVKLPSANYLDESKMATFKMAVSKMASFCCIASKHRFVPVLSYIRPLYWKATEVIVGTTSNPLSWFYAASKRL